MISIWHLAWIIPLTIFVTIFYMAMAHAASDKEDK